MVDAAMSDVTPLCLRDPITLFKTIRARPVEPGVCLILNPVYVEGSESHGGFILDKDVQPCVAFPIPPVNPSHDANMTGLRQACTILESAAGRDVKKKRYMETMAEMRKYITVPQGMIVDA